MKLTTILFAIVGATSLCAAAPTKLAQPVPKDWHLKALAVEAGERKGTQDLEAESSSRVSRRSFWCDRWNRLSWKNHSQECHDEYKAEHGGDDWYARLSHSLSQALLMICR